MNICEKLARNLKELSTNNETKKENQKGRCTCLNFWIYGEISKLYTNEDKNLTGITEIDNLIDANIKINNDFFKDDFDVNYKDIAPQTAPVQVQQFQFLEIHKRVLVLKNH
ncbi:Plasmodium vivax Vir protein, putative [Plasmodium vivax]|uniref:Vir protein n=1 Tax=Plasmodium vivax (strain Salvador I) TaxID=126793 RepID=A5KCV4_PLAVS|nr:hypothetical protein PVX_108765 [Plasmodium vivax]EDL42814.1 hypothetical protein PVX_108765 [Plasmodium vivax]CAI7720781.1 Plasmodium vivax Vir protein, putative [Plasmodium vivax]|eukprot:XP_001612601.1 hypothetical protein [Plasmodium vivax Sal-1]